MNRKQVLSLVYVAVAGGLTAMSLVKSQRAYEMAQYFTMYYFMGLTAFTTMIGIFGAKMYHNEGLKQMIIDKNK